MSGTPSSQAQFKVLANSEYPALRYLPFDFSDDNATLIPAYCQLRVQLYEAEGMDYYTPSPITIYDKLPTTIFIIPVLNGEVIGGRRIVIHEPGSNTKFSTEATIPNPTIPQMLSHLNVKAMRYAELGGICIRPDCRGKGYAEEMYRITFEIVNALDIAFMVTEAVPTMLARIIREAKKNGAKQIIPRPDFRTIDGDEDFRTFISFRSEAKLPLLSKEDKAKGIGKSLTREEIKILIANRQKIIASRKQE